MSQPKSNEGYKETAERYVREQLPELMELSFGCEVKVTEEYDSFTNEYKSEIYTFRGVLLDIQGPSFDPEVTDGVTYYNIRNRDNGCIETHEQGEVEIIGHPIQLQHWLRVIRTFDIAMKDENLLEVRTFERETPASKKPIRKKVFFNLTTGQPATEDDYKAFCEIVSITSEDKN